jgi:hypothetical protein
MKIFEQISLLAVGVRFETELAELFEWDYEKAEQIQECFLQALTKLAKEGKLLDSLCEGIKRHADSSLTDEEIKTCVSILDSLIDQSSLIIDKGVEYVN